MDIVNNFLSLKGWQPSQDVLDDLIESPLLPLLENTFRGCNWIDMSKHPQLNHSYF